MKMDYFSDAMQKLSRASERNFHNPASLVWPEQADTDAWQFSPELISLYPTPVWQQLDEVSRKRLGFFEAINFFSLNIHGEKYLISEVSRRLYRNDDLALNQYLLHFIEEETKHMMYFSQFCQRYAGKVYPDNTLSTGNEHDPEVEDFLLFARIYLFEEIVDEYNRIIATDQRVSAIAREINHLHHVEEARHLAFGRKFLHRQLEQLSSSWDSAIHDYVRQHLQAYLEMIWKQYYNPRVYHDAGIADAFEVWRRAYQDPAAIAQRNSICARRLGLLRELSLIEVPS
jgi:hypothetical protein